MVVGLSPVAVTQTSHCAPASSEVFLDFEATIECGFTLRLVRYMKRTYNLKCFAKIVEDYIYFFKMFYVICLKEF